MATVIRFRPPRNRGIEYFLRLFHTGRYSSSCTSLSTPRGMQTTSTFKSPQAWCSTPRGKSSEVWQTASVSTPARVLVGARTDDQQFHRARLRHPPAKEFKGHIPLQAAGRRRDYLETACDRAGFGTCCPPAPGGASRPARTRDGLIPFRRVEEGPD